MKSLICGLAHAGINTKCLDTSLNFYNSLGFKLMERFSREIDKGTLEVAFIDNGGVTLELYQLPESVPYDVTRCGIEHLALEVTDLRKVQEKILSLGYAIDEGPVHHSRKYYDVDFILIRGPDGERVEFDMIMRKK